ncbi:MAG: aminotransferase class V-fold PLP-dependent enzyme, partial [Immundisolibacteraceae bacterium]|nr:aminotransferase class V-fold PLP-dependent enzyme [Immundisolibacteraceae bacterium]
QTLNIDAIAQEFPQSEQLIYLNHAAVAPWPQRSRLALADFGRQNVARGAADYPSWVSVETRLRQRLANLIGAASSDDIALQKSTSEALSVVAWGLDWKAGDNLILCQQEFPSNRIPWESLAELGVEVRYLDLDKTDDPEQGFIELMDRNTRLLSVSSVQYARGLKTDLVRLGEACKNRDILFCVDAIQSLGALPFDLNECHADFVMADGHKWMLGAEGMALFWVNPQIRDRLKLYQYGWHMTEQSSNFDATSWHPAKTAKRFECGSPNMLGSHVLDASLSLIEEVGIEQVSAAVLARSQVLMERIEGSSKLELLSDSNPSRRSGIVTFSHRSVDSANLYKQLMDQQVICANRGGGVRFSAHFYTKIELLEQAVLIAENCS